MIYFRCHHSSTVIFTIDISVIATADTAIVLTVDCTVIVALSAVMLTVDHIVFFMVDSSTVIFTSGCTLIKAADINVVFTVDSTNINTVTLRQHTVSICPTVDSTVPFTVDSMYPLSLPLPSCFHLEAGVVSRHLHPNSPRRYITVDIPADRFVILAVDFSFSSLIWNLSLPLTNTVITTVDSFVIVFAARALPRHGHANPPRPCRQGLEAEAGDQRAHGWPRLDHPLRRGRGGGRAAGG